MGGHSAAAVKLPIPGKRNILITSALPYVNNVPHLGNIIGCVLSGDVFARYCRIRGYVVIYICGTDDYGTATETKALEEGCSPKEICDKYHAIHKEAYDSLNISFDEFGCTSSPQQTEICQAIFKKLLDNNWLSENTMQQPYCDTCKRFLSDRLVEGTCPFPACNNTSARGDQCEKCSKLLNPTDLLEPKCKVCRNTPLIRDTNHLFLELPLLKDKLVEYIYRMSVVGGWSSNAVQTTNAWLREGLKPRCITRDLKWGVPVPHEKFSDKVFYVWFDAPIGYVSITSCHTPEWEKWWKNPENVELYQFMGKDNVPFHTVIFPSALLGTGENWTLMKTISVTEYLNYEAGKFSKSNGVGVFGNDVKDTNIPVEVWRYYLLTNRPETSDTTFTWADLQAKLNSELLSNLGNFINRVLSFIAKDPALGYGSIIPDAQDADSHPLTKSLGDTVSNYLEQYIEAMENVKLKQGLKVAMAISGEGNAYLQESQFWKLYKEDRTLCSIVMRTSAGLVYLLACLLEPFMPSFSLEVLKQLNLPLDKQLTLSDENGDVERAKRPWEFLPAGHKIGTPTPLFKELKDEEVAFYSEKFAGSQADRKVKADAEAKKVTEKVKKAKISAEMVISYLPQDILIEIFSRVPAKSIGKCRCLSKTWRTFLSTPHFIKCHLAQQKSHQHDKLILSNGYGSIHSIATVEDVTVSRRIGLPGSWNVVVGSCNGLVLLIKSKNEIFLVNPVMLSTVRIPNPPLDLENNGSSTLGFGYDSLRDDYKICYFPCNYTDDVSKRGYTGTFMGVYSVKMGAWETVTSPPYRYSAHSYGAFVNGAIHWLAVKNKVGELENWCVSALHVARETFFEIPVPIDAGREDLLNIVGLSGCLCVIDLQSDIKTDIWIMEEYDEAGAWIKLHHVNDMHVLNPLCFLGGEKVVAIDDDLSRIVLDLRDQTSRDVIVAVDNEYILIVLDLIDQTSKDVFVDGGENYSSGCTYFESLVELTAANGK